MCSRQKKEYLQQNKRHKKVNCQANIKLKSKVLFDNLTVKNINMENN